MAETTIVKLRRRLVKQTQMFFPDEPLNAQDAAFKTLNAASREVMTAKILPPTKDLEADAVIAVWDIVLING